MQQRTQSQELTGKDKAARYSRLASKQKYQRPEETKKERMYH